MNEATLPNIGSSERGLKAVHKQWALWATRTLRFIHPELTLTLYGTDADSADDERSRRRIVNGAAAVDTGVLVFTSGVHDASSVSRLSP